MYTPADLLMPLVKYKCIVVIQRDTETEEKYFLRHEKTGCRFSPSELVGFFSHLMFREEEDFRVASRLRSVLLQICGSHFVVMFSAFMLCEIILTVFICCRFKRCRCKEGNQESVLTLS